ncbi:probable 4-coumarate--CoA ligase 1 isoform X2 [Lepeophtheirus salmonis]|nr:probable 4-coumarate--CoA ligase 1 isoform X2 [Lepeophtheirus salmonis]
MERFGNVHSLVNKVASGLTKNGFVKGDVLTLYCSNFVEYWILALGVWTCGGIVMPVNCELPPDELELQMRESKTKILVCDDFNYVDGLDFLENTNMIEKLIIIGNECTAQDKVILMTDLLNDDGKKVPQKVIFDWAKDVIYMPFTSTSSGAKGILHTNKSLMSQFYSPDGAANHWFDQLIGDSIHCANYFFHMTGFYNFALGSIYGISIYTLSEFSEQNFLEALVDTKTASISCYAWQIRILSQSPLVSNYDLSSLKVLMTGCGLLSSTIRMEVLDRIPSIKYVREAYGLNECGLVTLTYPREKKNSIASSKAADVPDDHIIPMGLPNMYSMIKIISRQDGNPVDGPDQQGEICVKSPQCMLGYLNKEESSAFDNDQYFHTGDLGYYDNQGIVYFVEKINNLIQFWMYEVAPSILESRLLGSNNIVDAAVVGIPNKENGQVPRAFVVLKPGFEETEENLTNLMESRLQDHERIRGGLYFVQNIPRDENWKVLRSVLAEYKPHEGVTSLATDNVETNLAAAVAVSPKINKKMVLELEKQPNGSFLAPTLNEELAEACGVSRVKRNASTREKDRRSSMDRIREGEVSVNVGSSAPGKSRRMSSARGSRRGSVVDALSSLESSHDMGQNNLTYWLQITINTEAIEEYLKSHPAVEDAVVRGVTIEGIGELPRGYVSLKQGYDTSSEDILSNMNAKVLDTEQLRGGLVIIDKIGRDMNGKVIMNLEKYDKNVVGTDNDLILKGRQRKI